MTKEGFLTQSIKSTDQHVLNCLDALTAMRASSSEITSCVEEVLNRGDGQLDSEDFSKFHAPVGSCSGRSQLTKQKPQPKSSFYEKIVIPLLVAIITAILYWSAEQFWDVRDGKFSQKEQLALISQRLGTIEASVNRLEVSVTRVHDELQKHEVRLARLELDAKLPPQIAKLSTVTPRPTDAQEAANIDALQKKIEGVILTSDSFVTDSSKSARIIRISLGDEVTDRRIVLPRTSDDSELSLVVNSAIHSSSPKGLSLARFAALSSGEPGREKISSSPGIDFALSYALASRSAESAKKLDIALQDAARTKGWTLVTEKVPQRVKVQDINQLNYFVKSTSDSFSEKQSASRSQPDLTK